MSIVVAFVIILLANGDTVAHVRVFEDIPTCLVTLQEAKSINRVLAVSDCVKITAEALKPIPQPLPALP